MNRRDLQTENHLRRQMLISQNRLIEAIEKQTKAIDALAESNEQIVNVLAQAALESEKEDAPQPTSLDQLWGDSVFGGTL